MRFGLGLALLVVGAALLLASALAGFSATSEQVAAGSAWRITPFAVTSTSARVSWSAGSPDTQAYLVSGAALCPGPANALASGDAQAGSFSATLQPGTTYSLYACSGSTHEAANFTLTVSGGVTIGDVIAGVLIPLSVVLIILGFRPSVRSEDEAAAPSRSGRAAPRPRPRAIPRPTVAARLPEPPPPVSVNGRTAVGCARCGKIWPVGQYSTCPACGTAL